jgi:hypothetical protein
VRLTRAAVRLLAVLVALDLVVTIVALGVLQADPLRAAAATSLGHAKVVVIVGPVGSVTDYYRALAADAVTAARGLTDDVTAIYSPAATWPVVRRALQGAAIVVYLGHGNGWPSPYSDALVPPAQDGLGLNPVAGADDTAHQYFGEAAIAREVHLAPGAVVLLHHLCYASGAGEPGMPDPSLGVAEQRVDNYGAGWLSAGAAAVIAEAHSGPAYYIDALLRGRVGAETAWRQSSTFHDHVIATPSDRTSGAAVLLDPDAPGSGYYRSIVVQPDASSLLAAATSGGPADSATASDAGSLVVRGAAAPVADLKGSAVAGAVDSLVVTFDRRTVPLLPAGLMIGTRWTPITTGAPGADAMPAAGGANQSAPGASPPASLPPNPGDAAAAGAAPTSSLAPSAPAPIDLVVPEAIGDLTDTRAATGSGAQRVVPVTLPTTAGLYRLAVTLHDPDGVAYDAATEDLIGALIVQVTGTTWVTYSAPDRIDAMPGEPLSIAIRVANTGSQAWGPLPMRNTRDPEPVTPDTQPQVVGRWVSLDDGTSPSPPIDGLAGSAPAAFVVPGSSAVVNLGATAPAAPGSYLLVVDLVTSDGVSLAAAGVPPLLVRVVVAPAASPGPTVTAIPSIAPSAPVDPGTPAPAGTVP